MKPSMRRYIRGSLALVLLGALVVPVGTWWLFVRPSSDAPGRADAAVVLSGTWETRVEEGVRLLQSGVVPTLVFVGRVDSPAAASVCEGRGEASLGADVICLLPEPDNTRNEVRAAAQLAERRGWRSLVLVTSTHHVSRAGMLLRRCYSGRVDVVGTDLPAGIHLTPSLFAHEWGALLRDVVFRRGC
jgi:uncharacterized SAM-binding protein YcdF (DUF218 family)